MISSTTIAFCAIGCGFAAIGCGHVRTPDEYAADTRAVLSSRNEAIKACYDAELRKNEAAKGAVVVQLVVEPETGKISAAKVDTSGDAALGRCVSAALEGLAVSPGDAHAGLATFTWTFTTGPRSPTLAKPSG